MKDLLKLKRIYLLALFPITLVIVLFAKMGSSWVENFYFPFIYKPLSSVIGFISSLFPFSVTELLVLIAVLFFAFTIYRSIKNRYPFKKYLLNMICTVAVCLFAFELTMGLNYYRETVAAKMGLKTELYTQDDLYALCENLVDDLNQSRAQMNENKAGVAVLSDNNRFETSKSAQNAYKLLSQEYPFLKAVNIRNKPLVSSRLFSYFLTTGIYIPFTFESNINTDVPEFTIPVTMCHELTHYRGFMRENEANFLGYLACQKSERADFRYSAAYMAFTYAYPKLHGDNPERAKQLAANLSSQVLTDIVAEDAYWQRFYNTPAADVSDTVYDGYLQANGVESGKKSYGEMVDLLIAYNKK